MSGKAATLSGKTAHRYMPPVDGDTKIVKMDASVGSRARIPAAGVPKRARANARPGTHKSKRPSRILSRSSLKRKNLSGVSIFAVLGTIVISMLMVLVVLAQISYNEAAEEAVRLSSELRFLKEKHRALELAFESSFDIKEIERIARDELGMSRPDATQLISVTTTPRDIAVVVSGEKTGGIEGFTDFIGSLADYFR
ncbi:MAG: cell division protein FtsL [Oscillospiraceae bacterium]|nr:cell division protein FtsL [Oscillospiraceae bacterium]